MTAEATFERYQATVGNAVELCMRERGFEYSASGLTLGALANGSANAAPERPESRAEAERIGLIRPSIDDGSQPGDSESTSQINQDPNAQYYAELSTQAQVDYSSSLRGCQQRAQTENTSISFVDEFDVELAELQERVASDPRMIDSKSDYAACLSENGFTYRDDVEIYRDLSRRYVAEGADSAELFEYESALAGAVWECSGARNATMQQVRFEMESEFVAKYESELTDFVSRADS